MVTVYAVLRIVYNWIQIAKYERGGEGEKGAARRGGLRYRGV